MKRIVYSCDWCGIEAPKIGEHPADWAMVSFVPILPERSNQLLCAHCIQLMRTSVDRCISKCIEDSQRTASVDTPKRKRRP